MPAIPLSTTEQTRLQIQSDTQRERTVIKLAEFRRAVEHVPAEPMNKRNSALRASYDQIIRQLEDELREYDRKRSAI